MVSLQKRWAVIIPECCRDQYCCTTDALLQSSRPSHIESKSYFSSTNTDLPFTPKMNPNQIIERLSNIRNYQSAAIICLYPPWVQFLSFLRKTWSFHQPLPVMCMAEFGEGKDPEETNNTRGLQDEGTDLEENVGWIFLRALNFYLQWLLINRKRNPSSSNGQRQAKMFLQLG